MVGHGKVEKCQGDFSQSNLKMYNGSYNTVSKAGYCNQYSDYGTSWKIQSSIPSTAKIVIFFQTARPLWAHPTSYSMGPRGSSPVVK